MDDAAREATYATIRAALDSEVAAQAELEDARARVAAGIRESIQGGAGWREVAKATGLTESQVYWRGREQEWPAVQRRRAKSHQPSDGVSLREAARRWGVSPSTVYAWLAAGRAPWKTTESGRKLVLLGPGAELAPPATPGTYPPPP